MQFNSEQSNVNLGIPNTTCAVSVGRVGGTVATHASCCQAVLSGEVVCVVQMAGARVTRPEMLSVVKEGYLHHIISFSFSLDNLQWVRVPEQNMHLLIIQLNSFQTNFTTI